MEITINDHRKIYAVQKEFSDAFPFLKLEFFSKPRKPGAASSKKLMKHISKAIGECRTIHSSGHLTIQPQMTVSELKQHFRDIYGLSVEIFQKSSGATWTVSVETANQSLEKQNEEGRKKHQEQSIAV